MRLAARSAAAVLVFLSLAPVLDSFSVAVCGAWKAGRSTFLLSSGRRVAGCRTAVWRPLAPRAAATEFDIAGPGTEEDPYRQRFAGVARLYGPGSLERLRDSHVAVVGLGGVGSWVAESLARSGIGQITIADMDEVCISNTNRQLCALDATVGRFKADVVADRITQINPECKVTVVKSFVVGENVVSILSSLLDPRRHAPPLSFVVDAIDGVDDKCALLTACTVLGVPAVTSGGAGGLTDPTAVQCTDLAKARSDNLLFMVRKKMRQRYGFPQGTPTRSSKRVKPWGIRAVFSDEQIDTLPDAAPGDGASGEEVAALGGFRACDTSFGTSSAVTGTIGLTLAAEVTRAIAHGLARAPHIKIRPPEPGSEGLGYRRTAKDDVPQPLSTPADAL